jgi:penicillin-insensitive murein endopeptidase
MQQKPILILLLFIAANLVCTTLQAQSPAERWSKIATPSYSQSGVQSIGTYTSGCIGGAVALPVTGPGYQVMRLSRNRYYGHSTLIDFIQTLGQLASQQKLGTLLIGDLGQARGGPMISGHRSHQSGLDVDIWFLLSLQADSRTLSANERETWNAPSVVDLHRDSVDDRQWSPTHSKILEIAARQAEVERIFVHPSIKQELCIHKTPASSEWLRKIRPWWKHDDHFHVRLHCPKNSPNCVNQEPLPAGDGCDSSLAWWFSEEAKKPAATTKPALPPPLPALCEQLLRQ